MTRSVPPDFAHIGGDPSLDFVNTAEWGDEGLLIDLLADYDALTRWAESARVIDSLTAEQLRARAARRPAEAKRALQSARRLRRVLQLAFSAMASTLASDDHCANVAQATGALNPALRRALEHMQLDTQSGRVLLSWKGICERLDCIEWPVVWAAVQLLASDESGQIRTCAAANCGWMYVDRSRNGLRRWCQMETCGSRAKARRRYARTKQTMKQVTQQRTAP